MAIDFDFYRNSVRKLTGKVSSSLRCQTSNWNRIFHYFSDVLFFRFFELPRWFSDVWVPELLLPPKIIRRFGPKMAIFAQKYAFLGTCKP